MTEPLVEGTLSVPDSPGMRRGPARQDRRPSNMHAGALPVLTTKVALQLPSGLGYEHWERAGRQLAGVVSSSSWWLGDWLIYGKDNFADRYERGILAAGLRYQTLRNYAWVAGRFPPSRRRARLSFQHHAEVASMTDDQQEQWLDRMQEHGWTIKQLRGALRDARMRSADTVTGSPSMRRLAVSSERFRRWHEAAEQAGAGVDEWVMATLDNAASQILTD